jgi:hypothetical protein
VSTLDLPGDTRRFLIAAGTYQVAAGMARRADFPPASWRWVHDVGSVRGHTPRTARLVVSLTAVGAPRWDDVILPALLCAGFTPDTWEALDAEEARP